MRRALPTSLLISVPIPSSTLEQNYHIIAPVPVKQSERIQVNVSRINKEITNYPQQNTPQQNSMYISWDILKTKLTHWGRDKNEHHFADDIFKCIFLNENVWIPVKMSLKYVPKGPINNIPALVQIMAWRRSGDKSLSEPMMAGLPTHICVTRPQWVKQAITFCIIWGV